jgi:hypothetical protein
MEVSIRPNVANWVGTLFAALPAQHGSSSSASQHPLRGTDRQMKKKSFCFYFYYQNI